MCMVRQKKLNVSEFLNRPTACYITSDITRFYKDTRHSGQNFSISVFPPVRL